MKTIGLTTLALACTPSASGLKSATPTRPLIKNVGTTPPFSTKFDPLGFSKNIKSAEFSRLRESELKHARAAMIGATVIPLAEMMTGEPGINFVSKMPVSDQLGLLTLVGAGEFVSMLRGWENPFVDGSPNAFKLKSDYQPGDLGFGLSTNMDDEKFIDLSNKELNNGRLAMFGALGMMAQELVTGQPIF